MTRRALLLALIPAALLAQSPSGHVLIGGTDQDTAPAIIRPASKTPGLPLATPRDKKFLVLREGWEKHSERIEAACLGFDANVKHRLNTPIPCLRGVEMRIYNDTPEPGFSVGGTIDESISRLQVAGSCHSQIATHPSQETQICLDAPKQLEAMPRLYDGHVTGTTALVIRGSSVGHGTTPLIWSSTNGKQYTQGPQGYLVPYHAPISRPSRWTYAAYGAAVTADYLSTRYALSHGATDTVWRCSPHRPGCMNQGLFWGVAATHAGLWLMHDLFLRKYTPQKWRKFEQFNRKFFIGARFGAAAYNFGIGQGMKTR